MLQNLFDVFLAQIFQVSQEQNSVKPMYSWMKVQVLNIWKLNSWRTPGCMQASCLKKKCSSSVTADALRDFINAEIRAKDFAENLIAVVSDEENSV